MNCPKVRFPDQIFWQTYVRDDEVHHVDKVELVHSRVGVCGCVGNTVGAVTDCRNVPVDRGNLCRIRIRRKCYHEER